MAKFEKRVFYEYDDVDIAQRPSSIKHRSEISLETQFTRNIRLKIPIVSSPMSTVTESSLAIALAQEGGMGIIQRFMSIVRQEAEVAKVKRAQNYVIRDPLTLSPEHTITDVRKLVRKFGSGGIIIVDHARKICGIVTTRDLWLQPDDAVLADVMTPKVIMAEDGISREDAIAKLYQFRIEKLPLVDNAGELVGLITQKDINNSLDFPNAACDSSGQLFVGAALGVKQDEHEDFLERAKALADAGVDLFVIDVAHGAMNQVPDAIRVLKREFPHIDVMGGSIHTAECVAPQVAAGVDALRVGVAPGAVCTTRDIAGVGGSQLSAVEECWRAAKDSGVPVCADGGIRRLCHTGKAIGAGATTVMVGTMFAGTQESPGLVIHRSDGSYKEHHGMASLDANLDLMMLEGKELTEKEINAVVPEGKEEKVPYHGLSVRWFVTRLSGALRTSMSYVGARDIPTMTARTIFRPRASSPHWCHMCKGRELA